MKNTINAKETIEIRKLLTKHGVRPRQQMIFIAGVLGLEYVSIQQKFSGKRAWTLDQLKAIAKHFNEPLSTITNEQLPVRWNAILKINDIPQRCLIHRGDELLAPEFENLVAVLEGNGWFVIPGTKVKKGEVCYKVLKIDTLSQPIVAVLDDNPDITDTIATMFAWHGLEVHQFSAIEPMLESAKSKPFDGYILDWMLGRSDTVESAIVCIRDKFASDAPITILTGELRTKDVNQSDIARMVVNYNVTVLEKPAVLEILTQSFYKLLFHSPSTVPLGKM